MLYKILPTTNVTNTYYYIFLLEYILLLHLYLNGVYFCVKRQVMVFSSADRYLLQCHRFIFTEALPLFNYAQNQLST